MRIDLAGERLEPRLIQPELLRLQLALVTDVVPDPERQRHREHRARANGQDGQRARTIPDLLQREHHNGPRAEQPRDREPQQLREDYRRQTSDLVNAAAQIRTLPQQAVYGAEA